MSLNSCHDQLQAINKYIKVNTKDVVEISKLVMQNAPITSAQSDFNKDELANTIRAIVKEELEEHEKKLSEILKSQLQNTNDRPDKIHNKVLEITKSLEFTQGKLDEELATMKNDISKIWKH